MTPKNRQILLVILMVFMCLLVLKRYLPKIQFPTAKRVEERKLALLSFQTDLQVEQKKQQDHLVEVQEMQSLTKPYWLPTTPTAPVDQEISAAFNQITRLSQLSSATGTQKVDVNNKDKSSSCFQEVILSVDFKDVSMHDLSRFFHLLRSTPTGQKFRWDYCKVTPNNSKTPTAVNMSARFKILVLNNDTMTFLGLTKNTSAAIPGKSSSGITPAASSGQSTRGTTPAAASGKSTRGTTPAPKKK